MATYKKDTEMVKLLLSNGADVNFIKDSEVTPLRIALHNGDIETAELLVRVGADN